MIASWVERLGWMPPPAGSTSTAVQLSAPQTIESTSKAPTPPSPDLHQVQQIEAGIAAVRQAVERQLADIGEASSSLPPVKTK